MKGIWQYENSRIFDTKLFVKIKNLKHLRMKPGSITTVKTLLALIIIAALSFAFISWDRHQRSDRFEHKKQQSDTIPQKKEKKIRDLDEAIEELENIDLKEHLEKAMKEVNEAMKKLDGEKIKLEIEKSMKEVDFDKIKMEMDKDMKEIDLVKIEKEVK